MLFKDYIIKIIDMRFDNYKKYDFSNSVFIGISTLTGKQLKFALEVSNYIKLKFPDTKIVWGGIHASLCPEQSLKNKSVDFIVKGEGEQTSLELANALVNKESFKKIKGLFYKDSKGKIIKNVDRPFINLDNLPELPYFLFDLDRAKTSLGHFPYNSSRGCPHHCKFCYNLEFNKRQWRARSTERVLEDLKKIIELTKVRGIEFTEDEFFVDSKRVRKIAEGLIKNNIKIKWTTSCRFNYFSKYDDDFIKLLKQSGCDMLMFGAESGSERMLKLIHKDITIEEILITIKKCKKHGIIPVISFICGFPKETKRDILKTLHLIDKIYKLNPNSQVNGMFGFTPYPETPLFKELFSLGVKLPVSTNEWINYDFSEFGIQTWFDKKYRAWIETISAVVRFNYFNQSKKVYENLKSKWHYIPYFIFNGIYRLSAKLRWKSRFFYFGYEWKLWSKIKERYLGHF
jgi:radical SAM superfamily enzyme YgiQ (UPF0313 family)